MDAVQVDPEQFLAPLRASGFGGEVALHVTTLDGHELLSVNAERVFPAASTIKVPLLVMALEWAASGRLDLAERVEVTAEQAPGAGVLHELGPGLRVSWLDALTLMIIVSDNTATNLVIGRLGVPAVNTWLRARGLSGTRLVGQLQRPPHLQNAAQRRGESNATTARDQAALLRRLAAGELLDGAHSTLALNILRRQQLRDVIGRGMPAGPDGTPLYPLASKSGELRGVHHDVGLLSTPLPLAVALLSEGGEDPREHPENRDLQRLSAALWPVLARCGAAE